MHQSYDHVIVHSHRRCQIQPETYNGKTSVDDFIEHFELISNWNQWTIEEQPLQLAMNLRGAAQSLFKTQPVDRKQTIIQFSHCCDETLAG